MEHYLSKERAEACLEPSHAFFLCVLRLNPERCLVIAQEIEAAGN